MSTKPFPFYIASAESRATIEWVDSYMSILPMCTGIEFEIEESGGSYFLWGRDPLNLLSHQEKKNLGEIGKAYVIGRDTAMDPQVTWLDGVS